MGQLVSSSNVMDLVVKSFISGIWIAVETMWVNWWPFIIGFIGVVVIGVILQIIMLRLSNYNKLSPRFNRLVGSLTYIIFFVSITAIAYLIFGTAVIDEIWFGIFGIIAFPLVKVFLRAIGFWYY